MRKQQPFRGTSKPWPHQQFVIKQIPNAERVIATESWWQRHALASAPPREEFVREVERRAVGRLDRGPKAMQKPAKEIRQRPEAACAVCGNLVVFKPRGPQKVYCSHACNQKAWKARRTA